MREKIIINNDLLVKEYLDKQKSISNLSKEFDISYKVIKRNLIENGIKIRTGKEQQKIDYKYSRYRIISISKDILVKEYLENEKSIQQVSRELKICPIVIRKNLIKNKIKIRKYKEQQIIDRKKERYGKIKIERDLLVREYLDNEKSMQQIYREFKIHPSVLRRNLIDNKIGLRSDKEQMILDYKHKRNKSLNPLAEDIANYPEFFYVLGAFEGDGHFNIKQSKVQIGVTEICFLEEIKRILNIFSPITRVNIVPHTKTKGNVQAQWRINLSCVEFFNRGYHKLLPKTKEEKRYYLKGLMDAEGSVGICKRKIIRNGKEYVSKDKWLVLCQADTTKLDLWGSWLKELGVDTNKCYREDHRSTLSIRSNESIKNYHKDIGFAITKKQKRLEEVVKNLKTSQILQKDKEKLIEIYLSTNFGSGLIGKMFDRTAPAVRSLLKRGSIERNSEKFNCISAKDIDIAESILGRELNFKVPNHMLLKLDAKNIKTSKVKSIIFDKVEESVDLSTPKYHNFFLDNGILSHNSTMAMQCGYYVAWMLAGGEMNLNRDNPDRGKVIKRPHTKVRFNLKDNVVFDVENLMKRGHELPMNSVIVYDEGREGLDAKSTMMNINRTLENFFQECGVYNHFIIIVLPDFFSLNKNFACARSNFLINTYIDENYNRGYFSFFNEKSKEKLYEFGRRKLGTFARYGATQSNFYGKFTKWLPFSKTEYDNLKREALKKKRLSKSDVKLSKQRDIMLYLYRREKDLSSEELSEEINEEFGVKIGKDVIRKALTNALELREKQSYANPEEEV